MKISTSNRRQRLHYLYREAAKLLKASKGKNYNGFVRECRDVYHAKWVTTADLLATSRTPEEEWVTAMLVKYEDSKRGNTIPIKEEPEPTPVPGKKAPAQACLDFDTPELLARIAVALESIADLLDILTDCIDTYGPDYEKRFNVANHDANPR